MRNPEAQFRKPTRKQPRLPACRSVDVRAWALSLLLLTVVEPSLAQDPQTTSPPPLAPAADRGQPPRSEMPWLDEVRTQRQAWEARRQAARDAFEARRRLADPQGAAHQEAWEKDVHRRREARKQRMEQDRQRFRVLGQPPQSWYTQSPDSGTVLDPPIAPQGEPHSSQIWDNNWYYRGY
jgi:hypothetical protein